MQCIPDLGGRRQPERRARLPTDDYLIDFDNL